jgi:hypothetical protein
VPPSYWGVWSRTLLQTPQQRDTRTFVRWMQLGRWHVDLRVPASGNAPLQGFSGVTEVSQRPEGEVCTWRRLVDYEPPRATVDILELLAATGVPVQQPRERAEVQPPEPQAAALSGGSSSASVSGTEG